MPEIYQLSANLTRQVDVLLWKFNIVR